MHLRRPAAVVTAAALALSGLAAIAPIAASAADVDVRPYRTIGGTATGLDAVRAVALDAARNVYVGDSEANSIRVFAPAATNSAPIRTIAGPATGISYPDSLEVDSAGFLYTANYSAQSVTVHAPNAKGNAAPVRRITGSNTGLDGPSGIALGRDGKIYVTNYDGRSVVVFAKGASGNVRPLRTISNPTSIVEAEGIAVDSKGLVYVSTDDTAGAIVVFGANATGNADPIRTITGTNTFLETPHGIKIDSSDNVYVVTYVSEVLVFAPGAAGNVAPKMRLAGAATNLERPWELALDADRNLYVANSEGSSVTAYRALVPFAKPSAARSVAVTGSSKAKSRTVTWAAPLSDGGAPAAYRIVVKKGSKVLLDKNVGTTARSFTLTRANLAAGSHRVSVTATNRAGTAAAVSARFSVAKIKPAQVRALKVKGKAKAAKRTISWKKPAWTGGAKITAYKVVVKKGSKVLVSTTVKGSKQSLKVQKSVLRSGKHTVLVKAKNAKGFGSNAKKKFRVKQ